MDRCEYAESTCSEALYIIFNKTMETTKGPQYVLTGCERRLYAVSESAEEVAGRIVKKDKYVYKEGL